MRTYRDDGNEDLAGIFIDNWNKRLKSFRVAGIAAAVLMVILGIVLCAFPGQSIRVIEIIAACLIMAFGIYELTDYFHLPVILQRGGILMNAVLNIFLGILLIISPAYVTLASFAFIFGFLLMIFGIDLLAVSGKLAYFNVTNYGWVIASGIISIVASVFFLCLPLASTIALNYILAVYLIVGGVAVFIESVSMKDFRIGE
jgi:uncharacterized membrane protein HdeD (DUF308 family)